MSDERSTRSEPPLAALGQLLAERGLRYELFAIGGGALHLLGLITRPTRDIDVVGLVRDKQLVPVESLPEPLQRAVADTAALFRLSPEWFNAGPRALVEFGLPKGALERAHRRAWGGLVLHIADRRDQICFKLYAAVDQGPRSKHFDDLGRLAPTTDELLEAAAWARTHDPSEGFRRELQGALRDLGVRDGNA
jgi:hypothetical protein